MAMFNETKTMRSKQAAILSNDPNRVLVAFAKASVIRLFHQGLNAKLADKMSDKQLLALKGIGPETIRDVKMACSTAYKNRRYRRFKV